MDLGSRSYFLILGEGIIALPVKIPVFNADEIGAVALWIRGIDFPGFAQQVHVWIDGQEADIPIDEECCAKCFDLIFRDDKEIVNFDFFYGGAAVSLFPEQNPEYSAQCFTVSGKRCDGDKAHFSFDGFFFEEYVDAGLVGFCKGPGCVVYLDQ